MKVWQKVLAVLAVIGVLLFAAVVGGAFFLLKKMEAALENTVLVVENVQDSSVVEFREFESPLFCRFSSDSLSVTGIRKDDTSYTMVSYSIEKDVDDTLFSFSFPILPIRWSNDGAGLFYFREINDAHWMWYYHLESGEHRSLAGKNSFRTVTTDVSPDDRLVLFVEPDQSGFDQLYIMDLATQEQFELERSNSASHVAFPVWVDSSHVAYIQDTTLGVVNVRTNESATPILLPGLANFSALFVSPTESGVLYVKARKADGPFSSQLYRVDLKSGEFSLWRSEIPMLNVGYQFSPDGSHLMYVSIPFRGEGE